MSIGCINVTICLTGNESNVDHRLSPSNGTEAREDQPLAARRRRRNPERFDHSMAVIRSTQIDLVRDRLVEIDNHRPAITTHVSEARIATERTRQAMADVGRRRRGLRDHHHLQGLQTDGLPHTARLRDPRVHWTNGNHQPNRRSLCLWIWIH